MPKRPTWRSVGQWPKSVWKREPNSENQTEQPKYRRHEYPAHMGSGDLSRYDPSRDAGTPVSQECKVGVTNTPMR
jgi:hypothetical protein